MTNERTRPHHRRSCWCDDCRRDSQQRTAREVKRRNAESRPNALEHYRRWTDEDLKLLRKTMHLKAAQQAALLNRTIFSVQSARKRLGLKPPWRG